MNALKPQIPRRRPRVSKAMGRACWFAMFTAVGIVLTGYLIINGTRPPVSPFSWDSWLGWWRQDPRSAASLLVPSTLAVFGTLATLYSLFFSDTRTALLAKIDFAIRAVIAQTRAESDLTRHELAELKAMVAGILAHQTQGALENTDEDLDRLQRGSRATIRSDPDVARLISRGQIGEGLALLRDRANSAESTLAKAEKKRAKARKKVNKAKRIAGDRWRRLGELSYCVDVALALEAYSRAAALDPCDFWNHLYLARLLDLTGRYEESEREAWIALELTPSSAFAPVALNAIGDARCSRGDLEGGLEAFNYAVKIARDAAVKHTSDTNLMRGISISLCRIGNVYQRRGNLTLARSSLEEAKTIAEKLSREQPSHVQRRRELCVAIVYLSDITVAGNDFRGALALLDQAQELIQQDFADNPSDVLARLGRFLILDRMGNTLLRSGNAAKARTAYEEARIVVQDLASSDPANIERNVDFAAALGKLGLVAEAQGNTTLACQLYTQSRDVCFPVSAIAPDHRRLKGVTSVAIESIGRVCPPEPI